MQEKIRIGLSTAIGLALGLAGILSGIATGLTGTQVAGLPPSWQAGIGVAALFLTKVGRYMQAAVALANQVSPILFPTPRPVQIPPVGLEADPATVAALEGAPTHPGEAMVP